jgi:hypothetical protein
VQKQEVEVSNFLKPREARLIGALRRMPLDLGDHLVDMADNIATSYCVPPAAAAASGKLKLVFIAPSIKSRPVGEDL